VINSSIIREPKDPIAKTRISLGQPIGTDDFYLVFRGDPSDIIRLLEIALEKARGALPAGEYKDKR
jgi:hypothetical protein